MTRKSILAYPTTIAIIAGLTLVGCNEGGNNSGAAPQSAPDAHHHDHDGHDHDHDHAQSDREPDTYTGIRGEITQMPDPSIPGSELKIRHEQIRDFITKDGTVSVNSRGIAGMMSMTMPFPLGEGVSLEGHSVGDKVSFDFVVNWGNDRPAWEVTRIEKLPDDTELNFENVIEDQQQDQDMADDANHDHGDDHDHDHGDGP